ncbi:MAG: hypothetical protein STSR0008_24470 [Ignavibacterium sp.]
MLNFMKSLIAGKVLVFTFFTLLNCGLFAQTPDPYKFFPSSVGNVWEYSGSWGYRAEIYRDSVDQNGYKHLFYIYDNYYPTYATFKIDTLSYMIYYTPYNLNWLYYKLDSDSGDHWIVDSLNPGDGTIYKLALCRNQYEGFFFNYPTTFKEITFYQYQAYTVINEFSRPDFTITLAYGIGEIMEFDEEGGGPQRILQGCIIDGDTIGIITSVEDEIIALNSFELLQNYPNPFNTSTLISYQLPVNSLVTLKVYDILGREVAKLVNEEKPVGVYEVEFNATNLPSGVYFYKLQAGSFSETKKLILLK